MIKLSRRSFIRGAGLLIAAPAIVRIESLMPVHSPIKMVRTGNYFLTTEEVITELTRSLAAALSGDEANAVPRFYP